MQHFFKSSITLLLAFLTMSNTLAEAKPTKPLHLHKTPDTKNTTTTEPEEPPMSMGAMHGMYGLYPPTREASGTSWQPQSTPMNGWMFMSDKGMLMLQGFDNQIFDHQGGPRGGEKNFNSSMFMLMAQRDMTVGTLGFRSMISFDPQMGASGYPLLLQTGETANGRTPLIDRQHPHDLFMELAGTYSLPIKDQQSAFLYVGLPGEPALGPPNFMMRWSGMFFPEAPITHHWLDSTHITYGVVTLGYIYHDFKLEVSEFKGREPDQSRWNIESPRLDSQSIRLSYNPTENWTLQISYGHVKSPEQLEPDVNTNRATASAMYNQPFGNQNNWQTTFAWGQDANHPGKTLNGFLLESALSFHAMHTLFGRFENVQKDELFVTPNPLTGRVFTVNKLSVGYLFELPAWHHAKPGIGAMMSTYALPSAIQTSYGNRPFSYMLFGRISIA